MIFNSKFIFILSYDYSMACFSCKKPMTNFLSYGSKKDILRNGYQPPENMSESDRLCKSCLLEIKNTQTKGRSVRQKVSVGWQVGILLLGLIVPFVWLYPFYKIEKLLKAFAISIVLVVGGAIPLILVSALELDEYVANLFAVFFGIAYFAKIPILFYFLIKWTRAYNEKYHAN